MANGRVFLIPSNISESELTGVLPNAVFERINLINNYIVENTRTARRFLIKAGIKTAIDSLNFFELNKHTHTEEIIEYLKITQSGNDIAVISEAGCPGIADPGAEIVELAHRNNIEVVPMVGPSSIFLTLMASGLNGQNFAFVGYLPVKPDERKNRIKQIEQRSKNERQTQLFMDTPYRVAHLFDELLSTCTATTRICVAAEITSVNQFIKTKTVADWKKQKPELDKKTVIFALLA